MRFLQYASQIHVNNNPSSFGYVPGKRQLDAFFSWHRLESLIRGIPNALCNLIFVERKFDLCYPWITWTSFWLMKHRLYCMGKPVLFLRARALLKPSFYTFTAYCRQYTNPFANIMSSPKDNKLIWKLTPEIINKSADELMTKTKAVYDGVGALSSEAVTYNNVVKVSKALNISQFCLLCVHCCARGLRGPRPRKFELC